MTLHFVELFVLAAVIAAAAGSFRSRRRLPRNRVPHLRAGVRHTGSYTSAAAQRRPLIITVKGIRVAFLAYTEFTNGISLPHPWSVNVAGAARILKAARQARKDGAQAVIVNLHWGQEYISQPSRYQLDLARHLTRSPDITAIVGWVLLCSVGVDWMRARWLVSRTSGGSREGRGAVLCLDRARQGLLGLGVVFMSSAVPDHWQIQDAKQRFSEMIRAVASEGPQVITRHGEDVAVVVGIEEYRRLTRPVSDLAGILLGGPKVDDSAADVFAEIEAERKVDFGRAVAFEAGA